ncbi:hypothetical protein ACP179_15210 [Xenorhabdus stockiae]|uniref:hypothetical protein n=1 Tax=Xenorhabdus stockiae TaxID=351614 RepID=UPI003CF60B45
MIVTYTQWISRCVAAARERIPGSIDNYVTEVSERSQQRGNLKDEGYNTFYGGDLVRKGESQAVFTPPALCFRIKLI